MKQTQPRPVHSRDCRLIGWATSVTSPPLMTIGRIGRGLDHAATIARWLRLICRPEEQTCTAEPIRVEARVHLVTFQLREESRENEGAGHWGYGGSGLASGDLGLGVLELSRPGGQRLGALVPPGPHAGDVIDLNRALAVKLAARDVGAPEAEADSLLPSSMLAFLELGDDARGIAREVYVWALENLERFDGPDLVRGGVVRTRDRVQLQAPVPRPGKLLGVARNYAAHAAEREASAPSEPVLFVKASSCVCGPGQEIILPSLSSQVDYEGELAVVIGHRARSVDVSRALAFVAGYTVANDVTARDFQNVRGQRFLGKSCDTFAPLGPALVTRDEVDDPQKLQLQTRVSGELRQSASTAEMTFSIAHIIAFASQLMTLEPGDVLLTGTPAGVGAASDPPRWLREGDVVDVEIENLGRLRNYVTRETRTPEQGPVGACEA